MNNLENFEKSKLYEILEEIFKKYPDEINFKTSDAYVLNYPEENVLKQSAQLRDISFITNYIQFRNKNPFSLSLPSVSTHNTIQPNTKTKSIYLKFNKMIKIILTTLLQIQLIDNQTQNQTLQDLYSSYNLLIELYGKILLTFNLPITQYYSNIMHNLHKLTQNLLTSTNLLHLSSNNLHNTLQILYELMNTFFLIQNMFWYYLFDTNEHAISIYEYYYTFIILYMHYLTLLISHDENHYKILVCIEKCVLCHSLFFEISVSDEVYQKTHYNIESILNQFT